MKIATHYIKKVVYSVIAFSITKYSCLTPNFKKSKYGSGESVLKYVRVYFLSIVVGPLLASVHAHTYLQPLQLFVTCIYICTGSMYMLKHD